MDFYTGQIIPVAFGYAPKQTAMCNGQSLPINQNAALYALLGITYGGSGTSFSLPNASGRTLVGQNIAGGYPMGGLGGEAQHTLTSGEMPQHTHALNAVTNQSAGDSPIDAMPATANQAAYNSATNMIPLGGGPLTIGGGGQPHNNMQPSTAINFTIVLYGIYPSRG